MASDVNAELDQLMRSYYSDEDEATATPAASTSKRPKASPSRAPLPTVDLWLEVHRYKTVKKVHAHLERICEESLGKPMLSRLPLHSRVTLRNGDAIFEQFLFAVIAQHGNWFPSTESFIRFGLPFIESQLLSHAQTKAETRGVDQVVTRFRTTLQRLTTAKLPPRPTRENISVRAGFIKFGKVRFELSETQLSRLKELYVRGDMSPEVFHRDLFALLLRYRTLGGAGLQAAIPAQVFAVLQEALEVDCELFASPLNCTCRRYCSAFKDVDTVFGSLGSCFEYFPDQGSFQANPPFTDAVVHRMFNHLSTLLARSKKPLSFVCVVPNRFAAFVSTHVQTEFVSSVQVLRHREHYYMQGNRNVDSRLKKVKATCDTAVYVLQNSAGAKQWPAQEAFRTRIHQAFSLSNNHTSANTKSYPSRNKD